MYSIIDEIFAFVSHGGWVLWPIFFAGLWMWALIVERIWYFLIAHKKLLKNELYVWDQFPKQDFWYAKQIRIACIARLSDQLERHIGMIKALLAICPLLGLLGTVTGMIEVFDTLAITGTGNPRSMASGVSKATIPTMAGMVVALSGLYFSFSLPKKAKNYTHHMAELFSHVK